MAPTPKPIVLQFAFDDFKSLSHQPGDVHYQDEYDDHNNLWRLSIFPGGDRVNIPGTQRSWVPIRARGRGDGGASGEAIDVFLSVVEGCTANANISLTMRNAAGRAHKQMLLGTRRCGPKHDGSGTFAYESREEILDEDKNILFDGALVFDAVIQIVDDGKSKSKLPAMFQPTNPALKNLLNLCESEEHADVWFKLKNRKGSDWTIIPAHKLVLSMNAPILAEFCGDETSPVLIEDTEPDVFQIILRYVYGGELGLNYEIVLARRGKDVIEAADRYDVVGLKMAVESHLVKQRVVNETNVAEWLVFADSKTCPLLKEYALSFLFCRAKDVMAHESSKCLKESPKLMEEVVLAMSNELLLLSDTYYDAFSDINGLSVDELRTKLSEVGLDVDGSKETLVSRLIAANKLEK